MSKEIWDPGLQSERTRLAWVRTAVALSTGGLAAAGLTLRAGLPPAAVAGFALASLSGGVLLARTGVRFRRYQRALHEGEPLDAGLDALLAWLGTLCVVAGAIFFVANRG
ncbi:YidH family protein [Nonomuraea sp. NPDC050790]|uniref:YidH family protein n=1 Tax=Nonomuraea sp. NPDC050790 TaxID=3364371 RepID=UPI0037921322